MTRSRRHPACRLAASLLAVLLLPVAGMADPVAGTRIRDLYYGEVLFHFYQDDHFTALTHLQAAQAMGRVSRHEAEAELLLGGLYLHYGQHARAEAIFARLLDGDVSPRVRDRAWFYLGKVRYQRGLYADALTALARISGALPRDLAAELPMLTAQAHMASGRFDAAAAVLDGWRGPDEWLPYARYNLGVALVRLGDVPGGLRQLERVGRGPAPTPELLDLRDKANLAIGYAHLQADETGQVRPALERVRLKGPFSSKALLGVGWADAAAGRHRQALTPWLALQDRDLLDSAVQESLLAVPYAYGQLEAHGSAAAGYEFALSAYDAEIARLDRALATVASGEFVAAALAADDPGIGRWSWQLDRLPEGVESRYLWHLVADHDFQEGLRNVRDLRALGTLLEEWRDKLGAFSEMVDTRREAYLRREPAVSHSLDNVDLAAIRARRDALAARLEQLGRERDPPGLATATELDQWQRLQELGDLRVLATPAGAELRERHRLLRGVLSWELEREYDYRLWRQRRELARLDELLARAGRGEAGALSARRESPAGQDAFAARIDAVVPRIESLQRSIAAVSQAQERQLQLLAGAALGEQRQRLAAYRVQAQFALATIYDRAATAKTAGGPETGR